MTRLPRTALALSLVAQCACAAAAAAQTAEAGQRHRFEASIGGLWIGGTGFGSDRAELRANRVPAGPFSLFTTETDAAGAPGVDARVGYWLTRTLAVEGGFARMQPELRTRISGDAEGAPALTASERLDQYFIDASVVWLLDRFRFRERTVPFVTGGAGYLRELHEGRTLVETGQVYNAGGGVRHALRTSSTGWIRALGIRLDGRVYVLVNGVQIEDRPRTQGAFSGSLYLTF